jgi:hypothetical protein
MFLALQLFRFAPVSHAGYSTALSRSSSSDPISALSGLKIYAGLSGSVGIQREVKMGIAMPAYGNVSGRRLGCGRTRWRRFGDQVEGAASPC